MNFGAQCSETCVIHARSYAVDLAWTTRRAEEGFRKTVLGCFEEVGSPVRPHQDGAWCVSRVAEEHWWRRRLEMLFETADVDLVETPSMEMEY